MSAKARLSRREKREALVRESDLLRDRCSEIWEDADRRLAAVERRLVRRLFVRPAVPEVLNGALLLFQLKAGRRYRRVRPLAAALSALLAIGQKKMEEDQVILENENRADG